MDTRLKRNAFATLLVGAFAVVAALALPGRAGAATFDYGTLGSGNAFYGLFEPLGSFAEQIRFNVATPFTVTLHDNFTNFSLVSGVNATLFNIPPSLPPLYSTVGSSFQNLTPFSLPAGAYELRISGTSLVGSGGYFSGHMTLATTTAPIPEPETYAMMLAGLGLMGFVARRRKRNEAAAA